MATKEIELKIAELNNECVALRKKHIDPIREKVRCLMNDRIKSIISNKEYITDLSDFKDKEIISIEAIDKTGKRVYLPDDERIMVDKNGRLELSSFRGGLMSFNEDLNSYVTHFHGGQGQIEILGFIDICIED